MHRIDPRLAQIPTAQKKIIERLDARAKAASRSKRAPLILSFLVVHTGDTPPELDGHVAYVERKMIFAALALIDMRVSRNGLHKLLHRLADAGLVELNGRKVRLSRAIVEDLDKAVQFGT